MTQKAPLPPPLTTAEKRWLRRLERVLHDMPRRLWLIESGDILKLIDRQAARDVLLHDGGANDPRVFLADVEHSGMKVSGVSG